MTEVVPPDHINELLAGYVLGELSPEELEHLRQMLFENPELMTEVYGLQEVLGLIPYALPFEEPPFHLRSKIFETTNAKIGYGFRRKQFSWQWYHLASGIAALLVISLSLLGLYNSYLQVSSLQAKEVGERYLINMLCQPKTYLMPLKGIDIASAASGSIVITPGNPKATLVIQKLPSLPKGQIYRLRSVMNGKKITWGQFNADAQGSVIVQLLIPPNFKVSSLIITLESWEQSPNSIGYPVMMGIS